jgi:hypothetical protein
MATNRLNYGTALLTLLDTKHAQFVLGHPCLVLALLLFVQYLSIARDFSHCGLPFNRSPVATDHSAYTQMSSGSYRLNDSALFTLWGSLNQPSLTDTCLSAGAGDLLTTQE